MGSVGVRESGNWGNSTKILFLNKHMGAKRTQKGSLNIIAFVKTRSNIASFNVPKYWANLKSGVSIRKRKKKRKVNLFSASSPL